MYTICLIDRLSVIWGKKRMKQTKDSYITDIKTKKKVRLNIIFKFYSWAKHSEMSEADNDFKGF